MQTRFLTVLFGVTFVLTLLCAVAAGAQDDATVSPGGGGVQVQQDQTQQIQAAQVGTMDVETQAQGCQGQKKEFSRTGITQNVNKDFHIEGGKFRVEYDVTAIDPGSEFTLTVSNGSKFVTSRAKGVGQQDFTIAEGPGDFTLKTNVDPNNTATYDVTVYDCKKAESSNNDGGGGNNDGGSSSGTTGTTGTDTTGTTGASTAQADDTTTGTADASADPATADAAAGDGANRDGSFRCESFLHVVRDENGALKRQYRDGDDEVIVQRFEQCLEADVLADTIPNRILPDTGGPPLLFGGGALLLVAVMVLAGRIIRR